MSEGNQGVRHVEPVGARVEECWRVTGEIPVGLRGEQKGQESENGNGQGGLLARGRELVVPKFGAHHILGFIDYTWCANIGAGSLVGWSVKEVYIYIMT